MMGLITILISSLGIQNPEHSIRLLTSNEQSLSFEFVLESVDTQTVIKDGKRYFYFFHEPYVTVEKGYPLLTKVPVKFGIPPGKTPEIASIQVLEKEAVPIKNHIMTAGTFVNEGLDFIPAEIKTKGLFPATNSGGINIAYRRHLKMGIIDIYPFQWDEAKKTLYVVKRAKVLIEFKRDSRYDKRDRGFKGSDPFDPLYKEVINYSQAKNLLVQGVAKQNQTLLNRNPFSNADIWIKIPITHRGLYQITYEDLENLGLSGPFNSLNLALYSYGPETLPGRPLPDEPPWMQPVGILLEDGNDGTFGPGDRILFYGTDPLNYRIVNGTLMYTKNPYTDTVYYWLGLGTTFPPVLLSPLDRSDITGLQMIDTSRIKLRHEKDIVNTGKKGLLWEGEQLARPKYTASVSVQIPVNLPDVANSSGLFTLRTVSLEDLERKLIAILNDVDTLSWIIDGKGIRLREGNFYTIQSGTNTIKIAIDTVGGTINSEDLVYIDYFELDVTQQNKWEPGKALLMYYYSSTPLSVAVKVVGPTPDFILDITNEFQPKFIQGVALLNNGFAFADTISQGKLLFIPGEIQNIQGAKLVQDFSLRGGLGADLIVITPQSFMSTLTPYVQWKREHLYTYNSNTELWEETGGRIVVVPIEKIFNQFGFGSPDPVAIRDFLRYVYTYWREPQVTFVLLVGDGTYDYKNILGQGGNLIPPYEPFDDIYDINDISQLGAWDAFFGEFTGDRYSEIYIGRLTVRDREELTLNVQKILKYETGETNDLWKNRIVLVSDDDYKGNTPTGELLHTYDNDDIYRTRIPDFMEVKTLYLIDFPHNQRPYAGRSLFRKLVNDGSWIFNVFGHGNPKILFHEGIFTGPGDYPQIGSDFKNPLIIIASCETGSFDRVELPHVIGEYLAVVNGGIATISATTPSYAGPNAAYAKAMISKALNGNPHPLGEIEETGKNNAYYVLLGDPSVIMKIPSPDIQVSVLRGSDTLNTSDTLETNRFYSFKLRNGNSLIDPYVISYSALREITYTPSYGNGLSITYLTPPTPYYITKLSPGSGFDGTFFIPSVNEFAGFPSSVVVYQPQGSFGIAGIQDSLTIDLGSMIPFDTSGPQISFYIGNTLLEDSSSVPNEFILTVKLKDEHGIFIYPDTLTTGEFGITLVKDDRVSNPISLIPYFLYDNGDASKGYLHYRISFLDGGYHKLRVVAYDNLYPVRSNPYESRSEKEVVVFVEGGEQKIEYLLAYPNPVRNSNGVYFVFHLTKPATQVTLKVFTISGRLIWSQQVSANAGYNQIFWNLRDNEGDIPANGLYYFTLEVHDGDTDLKKTEKLLIAR